MTNRFGKNEGILLTEEFVCHAIAEDLDHDPKSNGGADARHKPEINDVLFPEGYYRLFSRNCFAFTAEYQGRDIRCLYSCEALVKRFGAKGDNLKDAEEAFLSHRQEIQELARSMIECGKSAEKSELLIA
jgi:Protein of unknown function (DUF1488)